ncbi:MAG: phenylacetate--CoA ligase family protein [Chloroflexi bacterium]|nr:phenylacetate--CoA ligase family protein [Chloroflexota bacterium]MBV9602771.1 phenylacetate--CoA ligase family protein [Chloroflexota bacterium]
MSVETRAQNAASVLAEFIATPLDAVLSGADDPYAAQSQALELFHQVARDVPAYALFLAEHGVDPDQVQTFDDFTRLPLVSKANYHSRFPLGDLCRHGRLEANDFVAVSSGSTGQPTFWPRFVTDELAISRRFEQAFHDSFRADERRTLAVVCFALGTWVGGMFTTGCCRHLAARGYPLVVVSPGNNVAEILRVVQRLAPEFEQTVLLGYPPFLKDVVDAGLAAGVEWSKFHPKLVMAGEVFSEEWRTLVGQRMGSSDPCFDSVSLYGTADAGVLGNETPLSVAIRRFLAAHPDAARELFGESRLPTLVQYDPRSRFFEAIDGTLLFTGDNGIPLIRYHIADSGGVIPFDAMLDFLARRGFDPHADLGHRGVRPMPFAFVFGRADFTISYFGANVYPENVTVGLEQPPIDQWVTGKFVMQTREDDDRNTYLSIVVELGSEVAPGADKAGAIGESILRHLLRLNSEFANYVPPERQMPRIELAPRGDPAYFPLGVKHRYTRRSPGREAQA